MRDAPTASTGAALGGLALVSMSLLGLELLQTRIFSYALDSILLYTAVPIALLGLGVSGTVMAFWQGWRAVGVGTVGAVACAAFAIAVVASHALFARVSADVRFGLSPASIGLLAAMAVPYVFAGIAVTACLASAGRNVHRVYFVNLLGSALGSLALLVALKPLGAPALLGGVALLASVAGGLFAVRTGRRLAWAATAAGVLASVVALSAPARIFPFVPDPTAHLGLLRLFAPAALPGARFEELSGVWDPAGRVEFHRLVDDRGPVGGRLPGPIPLVLFSQDGGAGSLVLGLGADRTAAAGLYDRTVYGAAYHLRGRGNTGKALVIGLGGGPDIAGAEYFGVGSVTGVEINASAIEGVATKLAAFAGNLYARPGVRIVHMDGRSFVRSTADTYDLVVLSGVDTKAAGQGAGSLAISESHLYTLEAFGDYLDHLRPGGHLAVIRFLARDRLKLAATGVAALRARGVEHPERHFVVLDQGRWTSVIVGREPIGEAAHERLRNWTDEVPAPDTGIRLPHYDLIGFALDVPPRIVYPASDGAADRDVANFFAAVAAGREREYLDAVPWAMAPAVDDRPFFFDQQRRDRLLSDLLPHWRRLGAVLAALVVLAGLAIVAPVPVLRRDAAGQAGLARTVTYFLCLGVGFMALELALTQKLVLFLGHPSYALGVVLPTLLVAAGLGSAVAGRADGATLRRRIVPAVAAATCLIVLALDHLAVAAAGWPIGTRMGLVALALLPLGFALGVPFPSGLACLTDTRAPLAPWAIAANGFGSVLGAAAALPMAMLCGYRALIAVGLALYVVAGLTFPPPDRDATPARSH